MSLGNGLDLFRCGVACAHVTNPAMMFSAYSSNIPNEVKTYGCKRLISAPVADAEPFKAVLPTAQAVRI